MLELLTDENMKSILRSQTSIPEIDDSNKITIRSKAPSGSFGTPGFGDSSENKEFYRNPQSLHFVLDHGDIVGEGSLVIDVQSSGKWFHSTERVQILINKMFTMTEAEHLCVNFGGYLPSVLSPEEGKHLKKVLGSHTMVWLGAKKADGKWQWLDGRPWNSSDVFPGNGDCLKRSGNNWMGLGTPAPHAISNVISYVSSLDVLSRQLKTQ